MIFFYCALIVWFSALWPTPPKDSLDIKASTRSFSSVVLDQNEACRDLGPGESRTVSQSDEESPTAIFRKYKITKRTDNANDYDLFVNIDFRADSKLVETLFGKYLPNELVRDGTDGDLLARIYNTSNKCFDQHPLKSSDGRTIHLHLVYKEDVPSGKIVDLQLRTEREDRELWSINSFCSTMIHETLHRTGLVDSYQESTLTVNVPKKWWFDGSAQAYNCRAIDRWNNIMSDSDRALNAKFKVLICAKDENKFSAMFRGATTQVIESKEKELNCPDDHTVESKSDKYYEGSLKQLIDKNKKTGKIIIYAKIADAPKVHLLNQQMKAIINPFCIRDNTYFACSVNAYRTKEIDGCLEMPPECGQDN